MASRYRHVHHAYGHPRVLSNESFVITSSYYYNTDLMEAPGHAGDRPLFLSDCQPGIRRYLILLSL